MELFSCVIYNAISTNYDIFIIMLRAEIEIKITIVVYYFINFVMFGKIWK